VAYGFQYIPDTQADRRSEGQAAPERAATQAAGARIFRVGPATSAVAAAVESLYRDIEELRRSAVIAQDAVETVRTEAASA
jgi:hypothetical protein